MAVAPLSLRGQTLPAATQASGLAAANAEVRLGPEAPAAAPHAAEIPTTMRAPAAVAGAATMPAIENEPIRVGGPTVKDVGTGKRGGMDVPTGFSTVAQVAAALGIVLGIIFVGRTLVRKYVPGAAVGNGKGVLEVLARYPLGKSQTVVLLRIGSQIVALNQTKDASNSILVINEPGEVANILGQIQGTKETSIQAGFSRMLAGAQKELEMSGEGEGEEATLEANRPMAVEDLDAELDEMAAAKRQLMDLRAQVRSVRESLPTSRRLDV